MMLYTQAIIVTVLSALFLFMPTVNGSYWLLTALAAQLYMLMYLIMFIAAIKLRINQPNHHRPFKIPGGFWGLLIVSSIGIIGVLTTLAVSFIPPEGIDVGSTARYEMTLIIGLFIMCAPPFISSWLQTKEIDLEPAL